MANFKKLLSAPAAGGAGLNVEDVFSTYLYTGDSSTSRSITNNIDLSSEGGLVWFKERDYGFNHWLFDTERGAGYGLRTDASNAENNLTGVGNKYLTAFNTDGFTIGNNDAINTSSTGYTGSPLTYASWTFRKAPKFFDVVTYTGDGVAGREIAHNLGTTVGTVLIKCTSNTRNWRVWHRSLSTGQSMVLNSTGTVGTTNILNSTAPTDSVLTLSSDADVNNNGFTYVAYLFAHNDGDGNFGPTGDQDIIKCGTYTGSTGQEIDIGFEPQWLMVKRLSPSDDWRIWDNMRGMSDRYADFLVPNSSAAEYVDQNNFIMPTATGWRPGGGYLNGNSGGDTYIYVAIRRGPMAVPESATDVFAIDTYGGTLPNPPAFNSGFPVDMALVRNTGSGENWDLGTRLLQGTSLRPNGTNAEDTGYSLFKFDYQDGFYNGTGVVSNYYSWMWRRAPSFFDVVAYKGNGSTPRDINHNLGVVPEMAWIKKRDGTDDWIVTFLDRPNYSLRLNSSNAEVLDNGGAFLATYSNETTFNVRNSTVNESAYNYIAYLFASLDGVSKVGSYTGTGSQQVIDCGFTSGARFILTKRTDNLSNWIVCDTERGIVSGNDPFLALDATSAEGSQDIFDPNSVGFEVTSNSNANTSGASYIFYAIA